MTSGVSRGMLDTGFLNVLHRVALIAMIVGAAGSVTLMMYAGRRQESRILIVFFGIWVLSPFVAGVVASSVSKRWMVVARAALYMVIVVLTLGSLAIYGDVAFGYTKAKVGFIFLVVPLASWLLIAVAVATAAVISGRQSRRRKTA
jgi:hypothetical protein